MAEEKKQRDLSMRMRMGMRSFVVILWCLVQCCWFSDAILDPIDFLALQSIRKGLEDLPGSNFFASWDFTADPCNFAGVFCDSDKVVALNLGDPRADSPGLVGRIDSAIGKLSSLTEFTIVPGRVFGALPQSLFQLKNLRFLAISRNFINGALPANLGELRSLRTLDLSYNQLSGEIPRSIGTITELSNVILCHNRLTGSVPMFPFRSLNRLDLKHNNLTGPLSPDSLPPSLQYLSLSWNRLNGPVFRLLSRLDQLNYLDLSLNQFTGTIPTQIFSFPIVNLQLQRNFFTGPIQPVDQVAIPTVDLSYNRLSGPVSPMFSTVQNLYLNNNRFTGEVPNSLVDRLLAANIQTLYLQHNFLTGIAINPTAEIPLSSSLCLQYNCMVPPIQTPCPEKAGNQKTRPMEQCGEWRG
ncbi:putative inactive leucine-rich repeat receptor-like protein kinase IMK2 [Cucumis melo var. makuwa]|uniref:Inactive leucine-rich repeat receptor-like protein kinase IMK2 n=1 Tax=Cucumis melo var. makuwa TaxID=1194695 RepID=A0A5D3D405_CUCMM|nr:putative inactive leucine-rich repeat receptor-like protein kinase IMK2 [Cucumis melo var. makuwa]TYK18275.1 putative inactive leucine-rich repeat receptor-like protein kinase IMK2 [Cucumis melo var. makuwa]